MLAQMAIRVWEAKVTITTAFGGTFTLYSYFHEHSGMPDWDQKAAESVLYNMFLRSGIIHLGQVSVHHLKTISARLNEQRNIAVFPSGLVFVDIDFNPEWEEVVNDLSDSEAAQLTYQIPPKHTVQ